MSRECEQFMYDVGNRNMQELCEEHDNVVYGEEPHGMSVSHVKLCNLK